MKKIVLALTFVLVGSFMLAGCSKDEILNHYNNIVQSAGSIELTGKSSLQGEKEKGIDDYTGTYTADYANFSGTEYLFGGTSIKREAGNSIYRFLHNDDVFLALQNRYLDARFLSKERQIIQQQIDQPLSNLLVI